MDLNFHFNLSLPGPGTGYVAMAVHYIAIQARPPFTKCVCVCVCVLVWQLLIYRSQYYSDYTCTVKAVMLIIMIGDLCSNHVFLILVVVL